MDISIKITDRRGITHEVQVPTDMGINLMQVVQVYELEPVGTIGICGGGGMCSTCQCYIQNEVELSKKTEIEEAMLPRLLNVQSNSRLACQIPITKDLQGLEVELAPIVLNAY